MPQKMLLLPKNGHFSLKFKTDVGTMKLVRSKNRCHQFGLLPLNSENTMEGKTLLGTVDELVGDRI